jgi:hypothetical protein
MPITLLILTLLCFTQNRDNRNKHNNPLVGFEHNRNNQPYTLGKLITLLTSIV